MERDLIVIGGGSGGVRAARTAATLGARVTLVEGRDLGGTCVNLGCVPKKLLAYGARYGEQLVDAAGFGWSTGTPSVDWTRLRAAKDREVRRLNDVYHRMLVDAGVDVVRGWATLDGLGSVRIGADVLRARHVLIATGGAPYRPNLPGAEHALVSDDLFHLDRLPERVAVIGGGYVALEFASILNGLGVRTSLLYRGPLFLRGFDEELRAALAEAMRARGVDVRFGFDLAEIRRGATGLVAVSPDGEAVEADAVLLAVGRRPRLDGLGLDAAGVRHGPDGIAVDARFRTSVPGIHAVGDCVDRREHAMLALTPVALAEGSVVARALFGEPGPEMDYHDVPTAVFSSPNLATVGMSEEVARDRLAHGRVYVGRFVPLVHRLSGRDARATVKLVVDDADDRVVGAHMVGDDAAEVIQALAVAVRAGATKSDFDRTLGLHPTTAEEFVTLRSPTRTW